MHNFLFYAFIAFNFFAKLDFFLEAVFLTITPFVQAWSIFFVASASNVLASSTFPASTACSNYLTADLYPDLIILFLAVFFSITFTRLIADFMFGIIFAPPSMFVYITYFIVTRNWHFCKD